MLTKEYNITAKIVEVGSNKLLGYKLEGLTDKTVGYCTEKQFLELSERNKVTGFYFASNSVAQYLDALPVYEANAQEFTPLPNEDILSIKFPLINLINQQRAESVNQAYSNFITGDKLKDFCDEVSGYGYRDGFIKLDNWINGFAYKGNIGALFGLRRTGKTVILRQLAAKYIKQGVKVAYAAFGYRDCDFNRLFNAVEQLAGDGYQLILLDEVTRTKGFYDSSMSLADRVSEAKIVIAGTDSLMLYWAMREPLFGRTITAKTTGMRYEEYNRLFPNKTIADFVRDGGVLWDSEPESVEEYLRTSVIENMKNSVNMLEDWHTIATQLEKSD